MSPLYLRQCSCAPYSKNTYRVGRFPWARKVKSHVGKHLNLAPVRFQQNHLVASTWQDDSTCFPQTCRCRRFRPREQGQRSLPINVLSHGRFSSGIHKGITVTRSDVLWKTDPGLVYAETAASHSDFSTDNGILPVFEKVAGTGWMRKLWLPLKQQKSNKKSTNRAGLHDYTKGQTHIEAQCTFSAVSRHRHRQNNLLNKAHNTWTQRRRQREEEPRVNS